MPSLRLSKLALTAMVALVLHSLTNSVLGQARNEDDLAVRIELELLADPLTFPYSWRVLTDSRGLELAGVVPGEDVRERALHLARRLTDLEVRDRIHIQAMPRPVKVPPRSARELGLQVQQRLEQVQLGGPQGSAEIDIYPDISGVVTLRGWVTSVHDKLLASRCLRDLEHCLAVRNFLEVRPSTSATQELTSLPQIMPAMQETRPDPFIWRPPPFSPVTTNRRNSYSASSPTPSARGLPLYPSMRQFSYPTSTPQTVAASSSQEIVLSEGISYPNIYGYSPMRSSGNQYLAGPSSAATPAGSGDLGVIRPSAPSTPPTLATTNTVRILTSPLETSSGNSASPIRYNPPAEPIQLLSSAKSGPGITEATKVLPSAPARTAYQPMPGPPSVAQAPRSINIGNSPQGNNQARREDPIAIGTEYPSMRALPSIPRSASHADVSPAYSALPVNNIEPQGVSGQANYAAAPMEALRHRIASALGPEVTEVQVLNTAGKTLRLKIKVSHVEAIDKVAARLFQMPDLNGYDLKPEFEVTSPSPR